MERRRHVESFVIVVGAFHSEKTRVQVRAHAFEKVAEPGSAEAANDVPALDAYMARILPNFGESLHLRKLIVAGLLHGAAHGQAPSREIHFGIIYVITVDGKFVGRGQFGVGKGCGQMAGSKEFRADPIAGGEAGLEQGSPQGRNRKGAERRHWRELEKLAASDFAECAAIQSSSIQSLAIISLAISRRTHLDLPTQPVRDGIRQRRESYVAACSF